MRRLGVVLLAAITLAVCAFLGTAVVSAERAQSSVAFKHTVVRGIPVNLIYVNLQHPGVRFSADVPEFGIGRREAFQSFIRRSKPTAAINGTFFCTNSFRPIGDIVVNGRSVHFGGMGTGLCITSDNKISFVTPPRDRHVSWDGYSTVVCSGPRLVVGKQVSVTPQREGFHDPHVLGKARRTAVGVTYLNRLLLVNTARECSLTQLARIMDDLGCTDAINFDGGSSSGMYYRGKMIASPRRSLTNVLLVYD